MIGMKRRNLQFTFTEIINLIINVFSYINKYFVTIQILIINRYFAYFFSSVKYLICYKLTYKYIYMYMLK